MSSTIGSTRAASLRGTSSRTADPPFAGIFRLEVAGTVVGSFLEVSGLSVQIAVEEVVEGGRNDYVHRLPGGMRWPNLTLRRGVTDNDALFDWIWSTSGEGYAEARRKGMSQGRPAVVPRSGSVTLCGPDREAMRSWSFTGAFPVKWTGPKLSASSKDLASEELEISHCGLRSARPKP